MCHQCPTVGEFICWIFNCGRCHNTCKPACPCECKRENKCECEHKCEKKRECECKRECDRNEKRFECVCQEKHEAAPCPKEEHGPCCADCACKIY